MNIVHIDLTGTYNEEMTYQGVLLPHCHAIAGHNVTIITTCYKWKLSNIVYVPPEDRLLADGSRLIRIDYKKYFCEKLTKCIRSVQNLYSLLDMISPDIIMVHGLQTSELLNVAKYCKKHKNTKLYVDNHADATNSARGLISTWILHRIFYKFIIKIAYPQIDRIYYISLETKEFINKNYRLPDIKLEYLPLGGLLPNESRYVACRAEIRNSLGLKDDDILVLHAGKLDKTKRTGVLLDGFSKNLDKRLKLVLCGSMDTNIWDVMEGYRRNDKRILYMGWLSGEKLQEYLCACDLYIQPGTQSAILQNAVCCGASVAVFPHISYKFLLGEASFYVDSAQSIADLLQMLLDNKNLILSKKSLLRKIAVNMLDYHKQAQKIVGTYGEDDK